MTRARALLVFITGLTVFAAVLAACDTPSTLSSPLSPQSPLPTTTIEGASLLQERCTVCHDLGRIQRAHKTEAEWEQTVTRMIGKGAKLSAEEKTLLIAYLAAQYGSP